MTDQRNVPASWYRAITTYLTAMLAGGLRPKTIRLRRHQLTTLALAMPDPWASATPT